MDLRYYCYWCAAEKGAADLRQRVVEETCLYVCRQCGTVEGVWLEQLDELTTPTQRERR